jgi:hypothetical protein
MYTTLSHGKQVVDVLTANPETILYIVEGRKIKDGLSIYSKHAHVILVLPSDKAFKST